MQYVILFVVIIGLIALAVSFWYIVIPALLIGLILWQAPRIIRGIRKRRYFASEEFLTLKAEMAALTAEHNEVAQYVEEIRERGSFQIGGSDSGSQAHLATFDNTSAHNYRRDRNVANYAARNVHNCSLQVVRNAASDPLKYVMKYFSIGANEATLSDVEALGESVARLESAIGNLKARESEIVARVSPPPFILKYFEDEFMAQVGVELSPVVVPYPEYSFEYVSAGGNSSQRAGVTMDTPTIDALIERLAQSIRFRKSAAGQRALMTASLRARIKERDAFTCQYCAATTAVEPNLLLEVDHIMPISRGGLTEERNLQTLCWRCNRSKSNKILTD